MARNSARPAKSGRRRRASGGIVDDDDSPEELVPQPLDVIIAADGDGLGTPTVKDGVIEIPHDDGSVTIDLDPRPEPKRGSGGFDENLAEIINPFELGRIANYLLDAIQEDEDDRSEWLEQRANGMDLLAVKVERPGSGVVASSAGAQTATSTVRDPIMLESVTRFQANAYGELCPSEGPCKAVNYGPESADADKLCEDFQKDFNYYLTSIATEYAPDTRKMLFWVGYASGMFKKIYMCPLRRRPVAESVDGSDLILPSNVTDIYNSARVTHKIQMRRSTMRRMQLLGVYRDISLTAPNPEPNSLQQKQAAVVGIDIKSDRPEDQDYTVLECYCELDIEGFEHKEEGSSEPSGLPLPYRVTLDRDSRQILEVRRNWREEDKDFKAKIPFVAYSYITGIGIYGLGLLHYLGNITMALTAMLRLAIDNGMFANFPGFLFAKSAGRQATTNNFQVPPGGGAPVDTNGMPLRDTVMPLPFKELGPAFMTLIAALRDVGMRLGGTAETPIGEGKQDAPVGTTLAMIEQATKIEGSVHKALHAAQAEELAQLKELFRDDPEALWRGNRRPAMGSDKATRLARFKQALENCDIVPASDPNVPSHMHRLFKASGLLQMATGFPQLFNLPAVLTRAASMIKIDDFQAMLAPPQQPGAPGPDPRLIAELVKAQLKAREIDIQQLKVLVDAAGKQKDRDSKETVAALQFAEALAANPESDAVVDQQLRDMAPLIQPAAAASAGTVTAPQQPGMTPPGMTPMARGGIVDPDGGWDPADLADALDAAATIVQAIREAAAAAEAEEATAAPPPAPFSTIFPPPPEGMSGTVH